MTIPAPVVTEHAPLTDDFDSALTAIAGTRGRERKGIRQTATTAIESSEKANKRNQHRPSPRASTPRNDWTAIVVRME